MRFLTLVIVASFAFAGPLAPLAHAQQPAQPAESSPPAQPTQPMQPDLYQETLKAQRGSDRSQGMYNAEAVVVNVFLVPGRAITCAAGAIVGVGLLAISFGSGYRAATAMFHEGCGGKWFVKGDDLRPDVVVTDQAR